MQFEETQRFRQWWLWVLLLFAIILIVVDVNFFIKIVDGEVVTERVAWRISKLGLGVLLLVLFWYLSLEVAISEQGIMYRFYPLQLKHRNIHWEEVDKAFVREYKPVKEFGGWGMRFSRNGRALNVSGNVGLQIVYKSGRRMLIGTNKRDELEAVMKQLYEKGIVKDDEASAGLRDRY
jgi:hypothetical protein